MHGRVAWVLVLAVARAVAGVEACAFFDEQQRDVLVAANDCHAQRGQPCPRAGVHDRAACQHAPYLLDVARLDGLQQPLVALDLRRTNLPKPRRRQHRHRQHDGQHE
jgi:hypothetical protein